MSRYLKWFEGIRGPQGSVATTTLKLAQAINDRGKYMVGNLESINGRRVAQANQPKSLDAVLQFELPPKKGVEGGESQFYSSDQLHDLQSKLVLVAGKKESLREDIDKFIEVRK